MAVRYTHHIQRLDTRTAKSWRDIPGWFSEEDFAFMRLRCQDLSPGTAVELGTWIGRSLVALAPICRDRGCRYTAIDDFNGGAEKGFMRMEYEDNGGGERIRRILDIVIAHFKLGETVDVVVDDSARAAARFDDESISLCFVDASHSHGEAKADIEAWWPKIRPGGWMAGHDYCELDGADNGVTLAVDGFVEQVEMELLTGGRCWAVWKPHG